MNLCRQWPAALLSLAAFGAAVTAQELTPPAGTPAAPAEAGGVYAAFSAKNATAPDMREDVEILRRLLDQALLKAYGLPAGYTDGVPSYRPTRFYPLIGLAQLSEDGTRLSAVNGDYAAPHFEGVYLKGYGVVYTATLPPPPSDPTAGSKADARNKAPLDPWERTRMELHGQTPEPEAKAVPAHPSLSEVILKVLAENGRHFGGLQDGERITVAVTFREGANGVNYPPSATWQNLPPNYYLYQPRPGGMPSLPPGAAPPGGSIPPPASPPPGGGFGALIRTGQATPDWLTDVRNEVLLGDLHLKQGKGEDAVTSYMSAETGGNGAESQERFGREIRPRRSPGSANERRTLQQVGASLCRDGQRGAGPINATKREPSGEGGRETDRRAGEPATDGDGGAAGQARRHGVEEVARRSGRG